MPQKSGRSKRKNAQIRRFKRFSWSCWADSNRRPHPYQILTRCFHLLSLIVSCSFYLLCRSLFAVFPAVSCRSLLPCHCCGFLVAVSVSVAVSKKAAGNPPRRRCVKLSHSASDKATRLWRRPNPSPVTVFLTPLSCVSDPLQSAADIFLPSENHRNLHPIPRQEPQERPGRGKRAHGPPPPPCPLTACKSESRGLFAPGLFHVLQQVPRLTLQQVADSFNVHP